MSGFCNTLVVIVLIMDTGYLMLDTACPGATCPEQNDVVVLLWKCRLQNSVIQSQVWARG